MNAIHVMRNVIFCSSLVLLSARAIADTTHVHVLYGAQQGLEFERSHHQSETFVLHLGAFRSEQNAINYKKHLDCKLSQPVYLVHDTNADVPYTVFVGPFKNIAALHQASRVILSDKTCDKTAHQNIFLLIENIKHQQKIITLSAGPGWSQPGAAQTLLLQPDVRTAYTTDNHTSTLLNGEIFLGLERALYESLKGQLGFAVAGASNANVTGDALIDANPDFNNFTYSYNINHVHVALKAKLLPELKTTSALYQPYVSGSVGVGFNHAYDFGMSAKLFESIVPPLFQSNTTTAFTYTVGAGLQKPINTNWALGLGYELTDWGKSSLAAAPGQTVGKGLALNHVYVNEVQLGLTYQPQATT